LLKSSPRHQGKSVPSSKPTSQQEFLPQFVSYYQQSVWTIRLSFDLFYLTYGCVYVNLSLYQISFFMRKGEVTSQFWGSMHLCHLLFISKSSNQRLPTNKKKLHIVEKENIFVLK